MKNIITIVFLLIISNASSQGIGIQSGAYWVNNGAVSAVINNGGITNNGNFTASTSNLVFRGNTSTANSFIAGSNSLSLYDLELNKTSNGLKLNQNIAVSHQVIFSSGDSIFLNGNNVDLGSTGSLTGESETSRFTGLTGGYIQSTQSLNAPVLQNPGNLGLEISTAANLGSTILRRGHKQQGGISILRYFDIMPTNNTALNISVRFHYLEAELAGTGEGNLAIFESFNNGVGYSNLGLDGLNITTNTLTKNNIDVMARFTLSNISVPLSIKLLHFDGQLFGNNVSLAWTTMAEKEFDQFIIQKSINNGDYISVGSMKGQGDNFSNSSNAYVFNDRNVEEGILLYRLKMLDRDGHFTYSNTISIRNQPVRNSHLMVYPNPASNNINLIIDSDNIGIAWIQVSDLAGKIYLSKNYSLSTGRNQLPLNVDRWAKGIYNVTVKMVGKVMGTTFVKQ